jgi:hypothetical protein
MDAREDIVGENGLLVNFGRKKEGGMIPALSRFS